MTARFTLRHHAIMTTDTTSNNFTVIQRGNERQPGIGRHAVARVTVVSGVGMTARLALRDGIVMATGAGANNIAVIHVTRLHRSPGRGTRLMAGVTSIGTVYMTTVLS
jgi:hypothetical protein